jgi:glycosyltransferase involved in cell wall biosynthesis
MPPMKHALFVAYHYPPESSSSGVLRTLKHTRYLGRFGWRVTVLTLNREAYEVTDPKLEEQIPRDVRVIRTRFIDVKRHLAIRGSYPSFFAVPDRWIGWWPWAVAAGRRVMKDEPVDVIYSTSPHATAHLIGLALSRSSGIRWVADFRDPWYEEPPEPGTTHFAHFAARRLEHVVVRHADRVVASTGRLRDALATRYPWKPRRKFVAIQNGYDEDDFVGVGGPSSHSSDQLLIVHAGSINANFRDPRPLFVAIRLAAEAGLLEPKRIRIRFLGGGGFGESLEMKRAIEEAGLVSRVEFLPRVSYDAALAEISGAGVLLLLQASSDTVDLVPAKLFEYLRAGRPVLAMVPNGATAEVMRDVGGGWVVDPFDSSGLHDAIVAAYRAWVSGSLNLLKADPSALEKFSRERLAAELAQQFNALMEEPRQPA